VPPTPAVKDVPADVLVGFDPGTPLVRVASVVAAVGGRVVRAFPDGSQAVALPAGADRSAVVAKLRGMFRVAYAEVNATVHAADTAAPNDPAYPRQWGLPFIDAPLAWGVAAGGASVVVAVLDTGIDFGSPDLASKVWVNPYLNTDGYPGGVFGWNFVNNSPNVQDDDGHGSHVAGILAAATDNGVGIAGLAPNARIMPVKVLDSQGDGTTDNAVSGVYYAVAHGARVINASWGGDDYSQAMQAALAYANSRNVVFVTAAGNESSNNDRVSTYPASFRAPNELVVAAVDASGRLASFSNYGATTVDLAAPGVAIYSTVPGGYASYDGTSMATPFVSATVAMVAAANPGLTAAQLVARVRATVKPLPRLNGKLISPGVVDPYYALIGYQPLYGGGISAAASPQLTPGGTTFADLEASILSIDAVYLAAGSTPAGYVQKLFLALDGRTPTLTEAATYTGALLAGAGRIDVVRSIQGTSEALRTRVARWYRDELGSTTPLDTLKSDPGVAQLAGLLASGWSDGDVRAAVLASDAFYAATGGTPEGYVRSLYRIFLARDADPGGLSYFTGEIRSGSGLALVVRQFLACPEGRNTQIARLYINELGWLPPVASLKAEPGVMAWASFLPAG
jgi:subtilisin family serine protease